MASETLVLSVPGVSCSHCREAIAEGVRQVAGVTIVEVELDRKVVSVDGDSLDEPAVRQAIETAGYDVAPSASPPP